MIKNKSNLLPGPSPKSGSTSQVRTSSWEWEQSASSLPSQPGVYWFINAAKQVLYVGKAKRLKNRVNSYRQANQLSPHILAMVKQAKVVKYQVLTSELEALLIEAELIRIHQPPFNILLKDDKTPLYILITNQKFPRVLTVRKKEAQKNKNDGILLGPFPSAHKVKEVLKIVRPIFPWCNGGQNNRACFYYHLDLCPGACVQKISTQQYQQQIEQLILFLKGKKKTLLQDLKKEMKNEVNQQNFEKANQLKTKIQLIKDVTEQTYRLHPDLILPQLKESINQEGLLQLKTLICDYLHLPQTLKLNRIEGYDVSNTQGTNAAVSMVVFTNGQPDFNQYRVFNIKTLNTPNDYQMLKEALTRRQKHPEWGESDLMIIDGGKGQLRAALNSWSGSNPIISIAKNPDRIIIPLSHQPPKYHILRFNHSHPALKLVQQVRDEAHRFSKKQHQRRRLKKMIE